MDYYCKCYPCGIVSSIQLHLRGEELQLKEKEDISKAKAQQSCNEQKNNFLILFSIVSYSFYSIKFGNNTLKFYWKELLIYVDYKNIWKQNRIPTKDHDPKNYH